MPTPTQLPIYKNKEELPAGTSLIDAFANAQRELFFIENPTISKNDSRADEAFDAYHAAHDSESVYAYYPWLRRAICIPNEDMYLKLRTARNRNIITLEEQLRYRNATVGIAGLSVGSAAVAAILATGGPKYIKIADPDTIEISNLNRMAAKLADIGENKTEVAARAIWELDPFATIELWRQGVTTSSLRTFIEMPRLDVYIDEMDNIALKFEGRHICKELGVPVVMATDNGDGAILDVERFDLEPERPIFHGRVQVPDGPIDPKNRAQFVALANKIIDPALFTDRQHSSVLEIGKTLGGVAQLGTAARIAGVAVAYAVRAITTGADLSSGRYIISPERDISPENAMLTDV